LTVPFLFSSLSPRRLSLSLSPTSSQQQRKDVEGSLFVVRRAAASGGGCAVVILNKKAGFPNWAEPLRPECQFEAAPPYLLTRTAGDAVVGVWFYDASECERVGALLVSLAAGGQAAGAGAAGLQPVPPPAPPPPPPPAARGPTPAKADGFWDERVTLAPGYDPLGGGGRGQAAAQAQAPPLPPSPQQQYQHPPPPHPHQAPPSVGGPQDPGAHLAALFSGALAVGGGGAAPAAAAAAPQAPPLPPPPWQYERACSFGCPSDS